MVGFILNVLNILWLQKCFIHFILLHQFAFCMEFFLLQFHKKPYQDKLYSIMAVRARGREPVSYRKILYSNKSALTF